MGGTSDRESGACGGEGGACVCVCGEGGDRCEAASASARLSRR